MEDQVGKAIKLSIDLVITALLVGVVVVFITFANAGYSSKMQYNSTVKLMESKNLMYDYDSRVVNGSDIVEVITANARIYDFKIVTLLGEYNIAAEFESDTDAYGEPYGLRLWSENYIIEEVLGDAVFSKFSATLVKNKSQDLITGVKFVQEGAVE